MSQVHTLVVNEMSTDLGHPHQPFECDAIYYLMLVALEPAIFENRMAPGMSH